MLGLNECCVCGATYQQWNWNGSHCHGCHPWWEQEYTPVHLARVRSRQQDLPTTLTVRQWIMTLLYFQGKCAYCQEAPYTTIEHFIPIRLGGGTTKGNCVPSCRTCNVCKGTLHPDYVTLIPKEDIERVRFFLSGYA